MDNFFGCDTYIAISKNEVIQPRGNYFMDKELNPVSKLFKGPVNITLTQDNLLAFVQDIANTFSQYRSATKAINEDSKETLNLIVKRVNEEHDRILSEVKEETGNATDEVKKTTRELTKAIDKVNKLKDEVLAMKPVDGKDADEDKIISHLESHLKELLPKQEEIKATEVRDKLETLENDERLDVSAIKGITELLATIKEKATTTVAGGVRLLTSLLDVSISSPTNGQVLSYDSTLKRWKNAAASVGSVAWGAISGTLSDQTDLQTALNAKQPLDSDLTTIAGLTATTDSFMQAKGSAWAARTIAQVKTDLSLTGTNSGDQSIFKTIAVSGQSDVVADSTADTLTLAAGSNITITTDPATDTITIAASGGGSSSWSVKTANYTASNGDKILCNSAGGVFTITLPATPATGDSVTIKSGASAATNNITIGRNGSTIMSLAENMTVSTPNAEFTLVYSGSTWSI